MLYTVQWHRSSISTTELLTGHGNKTNSSLKTSEAWKIIFLHSGVGKGEEIMENKLLWEEEMEM